MASRATKRRAPDGAPESVQARIEVGHHQVALYVEDEAEPITIAVTPPPLAPERWAGDAVSSFAQAQGRQLWARVFTGALGLAVKQAAAQAAMGQQMLTLRVVRREDVPDERWWAPWELLFDPGLGELGGFVSLASGWSIVRGALRPASPTPRSLPEEPPLRVLVVSLFYFGDGPSGNSSVMPFVEVERQWLLDEQARSEGRLAVTELVDPDEATLLNALRTEKVDVVHVLGWGHNQDGILLGYWNPENTSLFGNPTAPGSSDAGTVDPPVLAIPPFVEALGANPQIGLVVLNGCFFHEVADAVHAGTGISVLGHQGWVLDPHAEAMTEAFYRCILAGAGAEVALADTKRDLERRFPGQAAWASMVLFTDWPPARVGWRRDDKRPGEDQAAAPPAAPGPFAAPTAGELTRRLHDRNLTRLEELSASDWSPVKAQLDRSRAGLK